MRGHARRRRRRHVSRCATTGAASRAELLPHVFDLFRAGPAGERSRAGRARPGAGDRAQHRRAARRARRRRQRRRRARAARSPSGCRAPPRAAGPPRRPARRRRAASEGANRCRILVVDDNRDSTEVLAYAAVAARAPGRGRARRSRRRSRARWPFRPSVALLDIGLPEMDGYELARRLKAHRALRDVRLIAVTGYGQPSDRDRALEAGFSEHVTKPFEFERLAELIEAQDPKMEARPASARRAGAGRATDRARPAPAPKRARTRR